MLRITNGPPDEMQIWIALGIATYLIVFTLSIVTAVVCGALIRAAHADTADAAGTPAGVTVPGPGYGRPRDAATATPRHVPGLGTAA